jgi:hypothetical protein
MFYLFVVLIFISSPVLGRTVPCCSRAYSESGFCRTLDETCCEEAGGHPVQGRFQCFGQTDEFGVDIYCGPWNELNGTTNQSVCCEYSPVSEEVACTLNPVCEKSPGFPKFLLEEGGCNLCPEFPPPEAHCRCPDPCCEAETRRGVVFIGLVTGLPALGVGACCWFLVLATRRDEEEESFASGRSTKQD